MTTKPGTTINPDYINTSRYGPIDAPTTRAVGRAFAMDESSVEIVQKTSSGGYKRFFFPRVNIVIGTNTEDRSYQYNNMMISHGEVVTSLNLEGTAYVPEGSDHYAKMNIVPSGFFTVKAAVDELSAASIDKAFNATGLSEDTPLMIIRKNEGYELVWTVAR